MTTPTLRQLDIFAQMVASGSIVECARAMGLSTAAVESDMHALEQRLGHQLFFVDGRHIRLTPAGRKAVDAMALLAAQEPEDWDSVQPATEPVPESEIVDAEFEPVPDIDEPVDVEEEAASALPEPVVEDIEETEAEPIPDAVDEPLDAGLVPAEAVEAAEANSEVDVETLNLIDLHSAAPEEEAETPLDPAPETEAGAQPAHPALDEAVSDEASEPDAPVVPAKPAIRFANDDDLTPPPIGRPAPDPAVSQPVKPAMRIAFSAPAPNSSPMPLVVSLRIPGAPAASPAQPAAAAVSAEEEPLDLSAFAQAEPEPEEDPRQHVTIAAHPSIFGNLQDSLTAFEQTNNDVAIVMQMDSFTAIDAARLLESGSADIAYFYAVGDPDELNSRYVWSEQMSLYVGSRHPLAKRDAVTAQDLLDIEPLLLEPTNRLRPIMERALGKIGLDLSAPAMESDNLFDIMLAVRSGFGYFAAFGSLARDFGKMSGIKRLPVIEPLPPVEVRQATRPDRRDDPVVASLAEYLLR